MTREQIRTDVLEILQDKLRKRDLDCETSLTEETRIVEDLDFESVNLVELCMAIGKHFQKKLPFQNLVFRDGQFHDFSIAELLTFLEDHIAA